MTTERDIRNQIRYAERKGMEKGMEKEAEQIARRMLKEGDSVEKVMRITGLSAEQINAF
ncbi:MAG: hypothetical protein IKS22_02965 [Bacteroidales bacterium]|nr:hypothetical protein [Bacteroidales bacterium]